MNEKNFTLATDYERAVNPVGWFASEKLWDIRCFWDGSALWTRGGNHPKLPASFTNALPKGIQLDGGIYCGRAGQEAARLLCQFGKINPTMPPQFAVYDAPQFAGNWFERITAASRLIQGYPIAFAVQCITITSRAALRKLVSTITANGGEGVILRHPKITRYETGRTVNALKIKNVNVL